MDKTYPRCEKCDFHLFTPIFEFKGSLLSLYDDHRYPGRCILAWKEHVENFEDLPHMQMVLFAAEIQKAAQAIKAYTEADRVNIAMLGNTIPHLHAHLIPRKKNREPNHNKSPWNHPDNPCFLPEEAKHNICRGIQQELAKLGCVS